LFLYGIFRILIGKSDAKEMGNLIKNTLIAGILIQMSWFLMAVAVDISTIATYGVGGLPLTVVGETTNKNNTSKIHLPNIKVFIPVDDGTAASTLFLGTENYETNGTWHTGWTISPCTTAKIREEELIIGREHINYGSKDGALTKTKEKICHYW
jgi:hypothetical protein